MASMSPQSRSELPEVQGSIWKVAARVPWPAVVSVCLYLPGITLWAVYSLRCKASTFLFLSTIAPVSPETVDAVTNTVNTTLITLAAGGTFIFALLLVLAIARSIQVAGVAPNAACPCARPFPSSFYMYRIFNMGFNIIVFFVDMAIILLMMGAFLWLVVAYAASVSIRFGVRDAVNSGIDPVQQFNLANQNYSTVVSYYETQLKATPPCVVNTTWFKGLNSSISSILAPEPDASGAGNTLLCPQSCLNLGSFATLFKLSSNCICDQAQLFTLQQYSLTVSTEAGVALGGSILIYLACCTLHAYLISQHVHAGYDYRAAKQHYAEMIKRRRRRHNKGPSGDHFDGGNGPVGLHRNSTGHSRKSNGYVEGRPSFTKGDDDGTGAVRYDSRTVPVDQGDEEMGLGAQQLNASTKGNQPVVNGYYGDQQHSRHGSRHAKDTAAAEQDQQVQFSQLVHKSQAPGANDIHGSVSTATAAATWTRQRSLSAGSSTAVCPPTPARIGSASAGSEGGNNLAGTGNLGVHGSQSGSRVQALSAGVHSRNESRSSGGSMREILLGNVPSGSGSHHGVAAAAAASLAAAAAAATTSNCGVPGDAYGTSNNVAAAAAADARSLARDSRSRHKHTSSSGSYESVIYHSPRNSDGGSSSNASGTLAGAAAAAGLLDLSPGGLLKLQQQHRQQQHWASLGQNSPATILEGSNEQLVPDSTPAAVLQRGNAGVEGTSSLIDVQKSACASSPDSHGSHASSSVTGDSSGSGRKSRQSHRRLPAFDLTNIPTNFLTVEGLEERQEFARSAANSRPCSPAEAAAAPGAQSHNTVTAAADSPPDGNKSTATADVSGLEQRQQPPVAVQVQQPQQKQKSLPVRRNITPPALLQVPEQDADVQQPAVVTPAEQQLPPQRVPFTSPLLPPPEQQQLLLQHQQQQLMLLLQQEQEQQHQWQQPVLPGHHRQWSTPSSASVAAPSGGSSPGSFRLQQHQPLQPIVDPLGALNSSSLPPISSFGFSAAVQMQKGAGAYVQQVQLQQPPLVISAGAGSAYSNGSPAGSSVLFNTPSDSPAPLSSTPAGTPKHGSLGALLPPPTAVAGGYTSGSALQGLAYTAGGSTPRSILMNPSSSSSNFVAGCGLFSNPLVLSSSAGSSNMGLPPTIPEGVGYSVGAGAEHSSAAVGAASSVYGVPGQQDVASGSPLERRRTGYRSSLRKGLMAYDQYKHRQRYQQEVSQPLDPRTEISRRYRNRVPAV